MTRRWEFDALRGLMLVLMTLTHLPTRFSYPLGHPLGFVSAAEGFVLLSGFMAGMVYAKRGLRQGLPSMCEALWRRALVIYFCQAALLFFLFTVIAWLGHRVHQPDVQNLMGFYEEQPRTAVLSALALIYQPALLDILPMYVLFMLASPWLLARGLQRGWGAILAVSVSLWLGSQFGLTEAAYEVLVRLTGVTVPYRQTGSFVTLAWQFLWVLGLYIGASHATGGTGSWRFPPWMVRAALAIALTCLLWRHAVGHDPFPGNASMNAMFDKWHLGPLRLIDLFALMVLALHFGPRWRAAIPRPRVLETLGGASLSVFCAHLVIVLLVLTFFGGNPHLRPAWLDVVMVLGSLAALYVVARLAQRNGEPPSPPRGRLRTDARQRKYEPMISSHRP